MASFVKYFFFLKEGERERKRESFERVKLKLIFRIIRDVEKEIQLYRVTINLKSARNRICKNAF